MANIVITCLLCILVYELYLFITYPPGQHPCNTDKPEEIGDEPKANHSDADIIGKSKLDMSAELKRMRERKEDAERKAAIAKGEMTEDGKEIATEVAIEDCEVEPKKVWKQVSTEELADMFDESDEQEEHHAEGSTIDDIDLAFRNVHRDDLTEEEANQVVAVFKELEGTELLDAIERQFADVGTRIDSLIDRCSAKKETAIIIPESFEDFNLSDYLGN